MKLNKIYNEDCLDTMAKMMDNFIDLTVTSPPYGNMRNYNGYSFNFKKIVKELYRVTKKGGIVIWVVTDKTEKGTETGTSFKQALFFVESGFKLLDTMIFKKPPKGAAGNNKIYWQGFEYMFVFTNENDIVYDCFIGSGTTAKMAVLNSRKYIGSEISKEYCEIAEKRVRKYFRT